MGTRLLKGVQEILEARFPDPYVLALGLTGLTFLSAWMFSLHTAGEIARFWAQGFSGIFTFTTQMALILITGYALALSPPVRRVLDGVAGRVRTLPRAVLFVGLVSGVASWIQWGLGLVVAALVSLRLHRLRGFPLPMLVASGYTGFLVWHSGLSGSIPLTLATPGLPQNALEQVFHRTAGISESILVWWNGIPTVAVLLTTVGVLAWMARREGEGGSSGEAPSGGMADGEGEAGEAAQAGGVLLQLGVVALGMLALVEHLRSGGGLNLNVVISLFLLLGMAFHLSPQRYVRAVVRATPAVAGILLQFPLYGGIQGMLIHSGLGREIAFWLAQHARPETFYLLQFLMAGGVNILVPSGGGQWVVQGPVAMEAARMLGVDPVKTAMAIAWGDAWTNMLQPFWALPLLGVAGIPARKIVRYTVVSLILAGAIWGGWCGVLGLMDASWGG